MDAASSDETAIKKMWKILSTNSTMDNMRKDLHEDPKFKEWQETINKDLQRIVESDNTKSYEKIFTELGGLEVPNSTDCSDKLENLIKRVVDQKLCFRRDVDEICGLLGYYTVSCGNYLPTFWDNVSVPSSRVKIPSRKGTLPEETKAEIFRKWDGIVKSHLCH